MSSLINSVGAFLCLGEHSTAGFWNCLFGSDLERYHARYGAGQFASRSRSLEYGSVLIMLGYMNV